MAYVIQTSQQPREEALVSLHLMDERSQALRRSGTHFRSLEEEEVSWEFPTQLCIMWVSFPLPTLQSTLLFSLWGGGKRKVGSLRTHRTIKGFPSESWKQYIF